MKINDFGQWNDVVNKIQNVVNKNNLHVFIVGGFVRDLLLGRPSKDLDLMVDDENGGIKLGELLHSAYPENSFMTSEAGKSFGVSKLNLDGKEIDLVAPRKEIYEIDSRKPQVDSATVEEDAKRRDFSVNALFIDLNSGEIIDYTGNGINDLKNRILRVANPEDPDTTMKDDPLRMLRLIRQASQLNFSIDHNTYEAVRRNVEKISTISKERIQEELNKMFMTDKPSMALILLKDTGLLNYILPDLEKLDSTEEEGVTDSKNVWTHTLIVIDNTPKNLVIRLAALFHDSGKPQTKSRTYKITCPSCNKTIDYIHKSFQDFVIACSNGICNGNIKFNSEKEFTDAFPKYDVHFFNHEKVSADISTRTLRTLKYPEYIIKEVNALVTYHMKAHTYSDDWTDSAVRRYDRDSNPYTQNLLDLTKADVTTKYPEKRKKGTDKIEKLRIRIKDLNEKMESAKIKSPLDGNELMQMFPDKTQGLWLQNVKNFLLNEVLEGHLAQEDKEGAKNLLNSLDINELSSLKITI